MVRAQAIRFQITAYKGPLEIIAGRTHNFGVCSEFFRFGLLEKAFEGPKWQVSVIKQTINSINVSLGVDVNELKLSVDIMNRKRNKSTTISRAS